MYLAVLLDLVSRRVVGWATSATNNIELALRALDQALCERRPRADLLHHTDRGSPCASREYGSTLDVHAIVARGNRTGDPYDNAVAESFFATLKGEHVDDEDFATRDLGTASIGDSIETFYNCARRHSLVGYVSPIEFELKISDQRRDCGIATLSTAAGRINRSLLQIEGRGRTPSGYMSGVPASRFHRVGARLARDMIPEREVP